MAVIGDGNLIKVQTYGTGSGTPSTGTAGASTAWTTWDTDQTNYTGTRNTSNSLIMEFTKLHSTSDLKIVCNFPCYLATGAHGVGIRMMISKDNSTYYADMLDDGPADQWGALGLGGNTVMITRYEWNTAMIDAARSSGFNAHTGTVYFYFQWWIWTTDTFFPLHYYDANYPKYGSVQCYEIER